MMFASTKEFDLAVVAILKQLMGGKLNLEEICETLQLQPDDFQEALKRAIDLRLIRGLISTPKGAGYEFNGLFAKITYDGLVFIEHFDLR